MGERVNRERRFISFSVTGAFSNNQKSSVEKAYNYNAETKNTKIHVVPIIVLNHTGG